MKIQVGDKKLTIRKWKGKDKKNFLNILKEGKDENKIIDVLVYDCIEEDVILSVEEYRYVLTKIREYSFGPDIKVDILCNKCQHIDEYNFKLNEIIKPKFKSIKEIKEKDITIKFSTIKNKDAYYELYDKDELYDFLLRIDSINNKDTYTLDELIDYFDNLDIDILENIMKKFNESKFKVDDVNIVECNNCKNKMSFEFDDLPNFFPESWFS